MHLSFPSKKTSKYVNFDTHVRIVAYGKILSKCESLKKKMQNAETPILFGEMDNTSRSKMCSIIFLHKISHLLPSHTQAELQEKTQMSPTHQMSTHPPSYPSRMWLSIPLS